MLFNSAVIPVGTFCSQQISIKRLLCAGYCSQCWQLSSEEKLKASLPSYVGRVRVKHTHGPGFSPQPWVNQTKAPGKWRQEESQKF